MKSITCFGKYYAFAEMGLLGNCTLAQEQCIESLFESLNNALWPDLIDALWAELLRLVENAWQ